LGQTKDYKICICCFSAKHAALRKKNKDWLAQNYANVSEWGGEQANHYTTHMVNFQWTGVYNSQTINQSGLVYHQ
jgi:hypothetical protein